MSEKLKIVYRPLQELSPYAHNARTHSPEQVAQLVESIKQFGWTNPVLIDEKGEIIAGHGRVMAAEALKMDSVPVIVLSGLTDDQKKAYRLADNRLPMNAGWDEDLLRMELSDLINADFDISLTGFSPTEIDELLTDVLPGTGNEEEPYTTKIDTPVYEPSGDKPDINKEFLSRASQNDSLLTSGHTSQYQNLTSNLENNWDQLTSGFQGVMSGNSVQLIRISNGVKNAGLNFLNGENFKRILTDVETGLDKLGKYVNGPDFNNDLNNFAENVAKVVKALSGFVGFAVEHPWLFGAAVLAGPSRVGAVAATTTGVAARVVGGSLLGATAGTVAGLAIPTNDTPTTSEEMKGLEGRFNFDYFNEVQEWQKNNPGKVWPGGLQGFSNQVNRSAYLSRGIRNNNPGNLNFAGQKGATLESGPNARFASFPTMLEGIAALDRQVMLYLKRGKNTIDQIIDIYAPSSDGNNTSSYKSYLSQYTGLGVKEKIDGSNFEIMRKLIQGIINHENGDAARAVSGDDVMRALAMNRGNVYSPNNTSQVIRLDVQQKPGSDILAQLAGMQQIPG